MTETLTRWWLAVLRHFEPGSRCPFCGLRVAARGYCDDECRRSDATDQAFA
jgi:hypothetical protein